MVFSVLYKVCGNNIMQCDARRIVETTVQMKNIIKMVPKIHRLTLGIMADFQPEHYEDPEWCPPQWVSEFTSFLKDNPMIPERIKTDDDYDQISVKINGQPLPDINQLAGMCHPSPYGDLRNAITKVDESVRKSLEIRPEDGLEVKILDEDRLREIVSSIFPGKKIGFQVNKLVLYRPGDFFKTHQDTPRDEGIGTLVIHVPDYHKNQKVSEESGGLSIGFLPVNHRLVAFHPTLPHSVQPSDRTRVVVTFYIIDEGDTDTLPFLPQELISSLPNHFGLILTDRYSLEEIQRKGFRGIDHLVYKSLISRFDVIPTSVLIKLKETWDYFTHVSYDNSIATRVSLFNQDAIEFLSGNLSSLKKFDPRPIEFCMLSTDRTKQSQPGLCLIMEKEQDAVEHAGNEARPGLLENLYFATALILTDTSKDKAKETSQ